MVHFTSAHCDSFWDIYYDMLKKPNDITKYSGHVSQHMLITHCCIHKDLKKLRENHHQEEAFFTFMSRSSQHAGKHWYLLCKELPKLFFNDAFSLLQKHVNQWRKISLFPTVMLAQHEIAQNITKWHLSTPIDGISTTCTFLKRCINIQYFINFATEFVPVAALEEVPFLWNVDKLWFA